MRIEQSQIDLWLKSEGLDSGAKIPKGTLGEIFLEGELHCYDDPHLLCSRTNEDPDSFRILTSSNLIEKEVSPEEVEFVKNLIQEWTPKRIGLVYMQDDVRMSRNTETIVEASGLKKISRKKINYWQSNGIKRKQLHSLFDILK